MRTRRPRLAPPPAAVLGLALLPLVAGCNSGPSRAEKAQMLESYTETAQQYYNMGELDRCEDQVRKGLAIDDDNEKLLLLLGWVSMRRGKSDDVLRAERIFSEVLPSEEYLARLGMATALEQKGKAAIDTAESFESGSVLPDRGDPAEEARRLRATAQESWEASHRWYLETLEVAPDDQNSLNGLMRVSALLRRPEETLSWAERLLLASAEDLTFWRAQLDRPDLSAREEERFRGLVQRASDLQARTHLHVADTEYSRGRTQEALDHLSRALELDSTLTSAYSRRAQIYVALGRWAEALADVNTFVQRSSTRSFDDPAIQRALALRSRCERELARAAAGGE